MSARMTLPQPGGSPPNAAALRSKYVSSSVETMSPGRMILALYDRFLLDLDRATTALDNRDLPAAHEALVHAQAIVTELHSSLDMERWPGGRSLADLYEFIYSELVAANVEKQSVRIVSCRALVVPLRDAWAEVANIVPTTGGVS